MNDRGPEHDAPVTHLAPTRESEFEEFALGKLTRVLGEAIGRSVFAETLSEGGMKRIDTADDLYVFAGALSKRGGFEGAVGGLLAVAAVMRGACGR